MLAGPFFSGKIGFYLRLEHADAIGELICNADSLVVTERAAYEWRVMRSDLGYGRPLPAAESGVSITLCKTGARSGNKKGGDFEQHDDVEPDYLLGAR